MFSITCVNPVNVLIFLWLSSTSSKVSKIVGPPDRRAKSTNVLFVAWLDNVSNLYNHIIIM